MWVLEPRVLGERPICCIVHQYEQNLRKKDWPKGSDDDIRCELYSYLVYWRVASSFGGLAKEYMGSCRNESNVATDAPNVATYHLSVETCDSNVATDDPCVATYESNVATDEAYVFTDDLSVGTDESYVAIDESNVPPDAPNIATYHPSIATFDHVVDRVKKELV
uniref:GJ22156 n=1 Tax=Solanum tuberosum TaxID=4113 RepID=M1DY72_SOLTU